MRRKHFSAVLVYHCRGIPQLLTASQNNLVAKNIAVQDVVLFSFSRRLSGVSPLFLAHGRRSGSLSFVSTRRSQLHHVPSSWVSVQEMQSAEPGYEKVIIRSSEILSLSAADHFPIRPPTSTLTYTSMIQRLVSRNKQASCIQSKMASRSRFYISSRVHSNL